jgi:hypothetical protein
VKEEKALIVKEMHKRQSGGDTPYALDVERLDIAMNVVGVGDCGSCWRLN